MGRGISKLGEEYGDVALFHRSPAGGCGSQARACSAYALDKAKYYSKETRGFKKLAMILEQGSNQ